jgi:hypothetical protein
MENVAPPRREDAQFRGPIRQRQAKPFDVRIAGAQFRFDDRDLAAAAFDLWTHAASYFRRINANVMLDDQVSAVAGDAIFALDNWAMPRHSAHFFPRYRHARSHSLPQGFRPRHA